MHVQASTTIRPTTTSTKRSPWTFFLVVFILSTPFGLLGALTDLSLPKGLGLHIPISGLMLVCPLTAAAILVYREEKLTGISNLLRRVFDLQRIRHTIWYLPIFFLMPLIMVLCYGVMYGFMRLMRLPLHEPHISWLTLLMLPILFVLFFIGAVGEEAGWMGYAIDPLQARWTALGGTLIVGAVWALWHTVTYLQARNTLTWVIAQTLGTIALRLFIVWLYNNTGKSLFAAIAFHAMVNVSESMFPQFGPQYDPVIAGAIMAVLAVIIVFLWGPKTLARFRYAPHRNR